MAFQVGVPDVAGQLRHGYLFCETGKRGGLRICVMHSEFAEIDTRLFKPGRSAGLESTKRETQISEAGGQAVGGKFAGPTGFNRTKPDMDQSA